MKYFLDALKYRYFDFESRSTRKEYWFFVLFSFIIGMIFFILGGLSFAYEAYFCLGFLIALYIVCYLYLIIPSLAISVRRLHDVGMSGLWLLLSFIPYLGSIALLVFYLLPSQKRDNKWGIYLKK